MPEIIDDKVQTAKESRKFVLQVFENLKTAQIELYDTITALEALINQHKDALDNLENSNLTPIQRMEAYDDMMNLKNNMNEIMDSWFNNNINIRF